MTASRGNGTGRASRGAGRQSGEPAKATLNTVMPGVPEAILRDERVEPVEVEIPAQGATLWGEFAAVPAPLGAVVFAHGSGSSRKSPRNVQVARALNEAGLATLLFDLLTEREAAERVNVFDVPMLARRLLAATAWLRDQPEMNGVPVGYFGASTGAAAALWAATAPEAAIAAVVSRDGRPDLAALRLASVATPTLLIVGSEDKDVLRLNQLALGLVSAPARLEIVPGATHLFEEPGALQRVSELAKEWFLNHFAEAWRGREKVATRGSGPPCPDYIEVPSAA